MSEFKPFYQDGTEVRPGDLVRRCQTRFERIGNVYPPEDILSQHVDAPEGCAEIGSSTLEYLPLDEDTEFIARGSIGDEIPYYSA